MSVPLYNVEEYEIVLANGTIANISHKQHPEVVTAIRVAGIQFGMLRSRTSRKDQANFVRNHLNLP